MTLTPRLALLATLIAVIGFTAPVQAQDTPAVPDTIVVRTPENDARRRFNEGNDLLRQEEYEAALAKFDAGLELDPTSARNAYGRALAFAQMEQEEDAVAAFQQAIALSEAGTDAETGTAARRALGTIAYRNATSKLQGFPLPRQNAEEALPLLEQAEAGNVDSPQLPYQFARVFNTLERWDDAERYALQAIGAVEGEDGDKSALYYELGLARMGKSDAAGAREAFETAKEGQWSGWAEYQIGQLDAQETGG